MQEDVLREFFGILDRTNAEATNGNLESSIKSLPRSNEEFQKCQLKAILYRKLGDTANCNLRHAVNQVVASGVLEDREKGRVRPEAVQDAVARLVASFTFNGVVSSAQEGIAQAAEVLSVAGKDRAANGADVRCGKLRGSFSLHADDGETIQCSSAKKTRGDDWDGGAFDLWGTGGSVSPRVDIEGALAQLEAGLDGSGGGGDGATTSMAAVAALHTLAGADPEAFQFGDHWPSFLELSGRALDSKDPAVHTKALTLHWSMYEKAMGMNAADLCEAVLAHARRYFATTVHVVSTPAAQRHLPFESEKINCSREECTGSRVMVMGDTELVCAAREARALHGMLMTIHETFQHLPERRVWRIVDSFLSLLGKASATSYEELTGTSQGISSADNNPFDGCGGGGDNNCTVRAGGVAKSPGTSESSSPITSPAVLLPAHFLAIAGSVDQWLPSWLRALPTGNLVRAVNDSGLILTMIQRCDERGRAPLRPHPRPQCAFSDAESGPRITATSGKAMAMPSECPPSVVFRHRLSTGSAPAGEFADNNGTVVPLGRALWLPLDELDRALVLQSIAFLGTIATHCRGALRPCPPPSESATLADCGVKYDAWNVGKEGEPDDRPAAVGKLFTESTAASGLHQGKAVLAALVRCVSSESTQLVAEGGPSVPMRRGEAAPSKEIHFEAFEYIGRLARATIGSASSPFTADHISALLSPLDISKRANKPEHSGADDCNKCTNSSGGGLVLLKGNTSVFKAMAEIAGVLLSSSSASAAFFVKGPDGVTEASPALVTLVQFTAELARNACSSSQKSATHNATDQVLRTGDVTREDRLTPVRPDEARGLAVDFAAALVSIFGCPPKQRAAGWRALWRFGVPGAMRDLVDDIDRCCCPFHGQTTHRRSPENGKKNKCYPGGCTNDESNCEQNRELCRQLLMSLAEWAQDRTGINALRRVGLLQPCASCLSRELARQHLFPATRNECPDPRGLALAARLALWPEGLCGLLCKDAGIVEGVNHGLHSLEWLPNLAEFLQSGTPELIAASPPAFRNGEEIGGEGGGDGLDGEDGETDGISIGSGSFGGNDLGTLRCVDFVRRLLFVSASGRPSEGAGKSASAEQTDTWVRWAISRAVAGPNFVGTDAMHDTPDQVWEDAVVSEEMHLVGLQLASHLATDLTAAVEMEARWSLSSALARQSAAELEAAVAISKAVTPEDGRDVVAQGETAVNPSDFATSKSAISWSGAPDHSRDIGVFGGILDPVVLARARLAVCLSCAGGPTEARYVRLQKIRRAEASAAGIAIAGRNASGNRPPASFHLPASDAVDFPTGALQNDEWFAWAGRCVLTVVAALTNLNEESGAKEAFALLSEAAARDCPCLVGRGIRGCRPPASVARNNEGDRGHECGDGGDGEYSGSEGCAGKVRQSGDGIPFRNPSAMESLCFYYAQSLGFVCKEERDSFKEGMRQTFVRAAAISAAAASTEAASQSAARPGCEDVHYDWFAAVAFLASGGVGSTAITMLNNLAGNSRRACLVWPLAGRLYAGRQLSAGAIGAAAAATGDMRDSPQLAVFASTGKCHFGSVVKHQFFGTELVVSNDSHSQAGQPRTCDVLAGEGASAQACRGDPPLLLLVALVEDIVGKQLPKLAAALRGAGWAAAPVALRWMRQCMLGVMDWPGVVAYMALALLRGPDYQVYYVVSIFRCMESRVVQAASAGVDLTDLICRGDALEGFDLQASLSYVDGLAALHHDECLEAITSFSRSI